MGSGHKVLLALAASLLVVASVSARTWRSDTQGRMPRSNIEAINRSIVTCPGDDTYDHAPELIEAFEPYYPAKLLGRGQGGRCVLEFTVTAAGNVEGVKAIEGDPAICAHSQIALEYWKFRPATLKGAAVPHSLTMPFTFEVK